MSDLKIRSFAAEMPEPFPDESLLGLFSRALERTLIVNLKRGLALANVRPPSNTSGINILEKQAAELATLFKLNREDIVRRLHPKTRFEHYNLKRSSAIDFFGTKIRTQYLETIFRGVGAKAVVNSVQVDSSEGMPSF